MRAAARDATGVEPVILPSLGGSLPQHAFGPLGVPCIWAAYANADQQQHAPNENLDLGCFREAIRTSATLFNRVADRGGQS